MTSEVNSLYLRGLVACSPKKAEKEKEYRMRSKKPGKNRGMHKPVFTRRCSIFCQAGKAFEEAKWVER